MWAVKNTYWKKFDSIRRAGRITILAKDGN